MYHLGAFETSLRSDSKKKIVRRSSDVQTRNRPSQKPKPPRIVSVQTKKTPAPRSLESLTDSAVDVSSQEETDGTVDPLLCLIWQLKKPKDRYVLSEYDEICSVEPKVDFRVRQESPFEDLLDSLKSVGKPKSKKVKDLITSFETKVRKEVCKYAYAPFH